MSHPKRVSQRKGATHDLHSNDRKRIHSGKRTDGLDRLDELNQLELDRFIALLRHKERPLHANALQAYRDAKFGPKDAIELANHIGHGAYQWSGAPHVAEKRTFKRLGRLLPPENGLQTPFN